MVQAQRGFGAYVLRTNEAFVAMTRSVIRFSRAAFPAYQYRPSARMSQRRLARLAQRKALQLNSLLRIAKSLQSQREAVLFSQASQRLEIHRRSLTPEQIH